MTRQNSTPVTTQGGNDAPDATVTAPVAAGAVIPLHRDEMAAGTVTPMKPAERAAVAVRHWSRNTALELWLHPGRLFYVLWHGHPKSMAGHRDDIKSRYWVPRELVGTLAGNVITFLGVAHHVTIGRSLKSLGLSFSAMGDRPIRFYGVLILVLILLFIVF